MLSGIKKQGQTSGGYAIVFAIVVSALITVQTLFKRQLQQGLKTGGDYMVYKTYATLDMGEPELGDATGYTVRKTKQIAKTGQASKTVKYKATPGKDYEIKLGTEIDPGRLSTTVAGSFTEYEYEP